MQILALGFRLATVVAVVQLEEDGCGDRVTDWVSAGQQSYYVCGAAYLNKSASTLKSGDNGLTLSFGNV